MLLDKIFAAIQAKYLQLESSVNWGLWAVIILAVTFALVVAAGLWGVDGVVNQ